MPTPADVRRAFKLGQGATLGTKAHQFVITSSSVGHEIKEQNERYEFPTALELNWLPGTAAVGKRLEEHERILADAFTAQTRAERIVYSAYGSPYACTFGTPKVAASNGEGKHFKLSALGKAVRRRDIPTLAQQKAEEREAAGAQEEVSPEDTARYLQKGGYRVIKSRFGTSKCSLCEAVIDPGEKIAKEEGKKGKGGWAHAACVVRQLKEEEGQGVEQAAEEEQEEKEEAQDVSGNSGAAAAAAATGGGHKRQRKAASSGKAAVQAGQGKQAGSSKRRRKQATTEE